MRRGIEALNGRERYGFLIWKNRPDFEFAAERLDIRAQGLEFRIAGVLNLRDSLLGDADIGGYGRLSLASGSPQLCEPYRHFH